MSDHPTNGSGDELAHWVAAALARHDPVPDDVVEAAKGSYSWRTIDAELAELAYDSTADATPLAGVRGVARTRTLSFEAPDLTVEVEVEEAGARTVTGQLVPPQPATVELRQPAAQLLVHLIRAEGGEQQQRHAAGGARQAKQHLEAGVVAPMQVLDDHQHRLVLGCRREPPRQRGDQPPPVGVGRRSGR